MRYETAALPQVASRCYVLSGLLCCAVSGQDEI